jgi:peptidoglycan/LPS O-acetylase OafA/YrhL
LNASKSGLEAETVAKYSYGIYLSHAAVMLIAFETLANHSAVLRWTTFIFLAVLVPVAMYHLIEHPMIRLGKVATRRVPTRKSGQALNPI